MTKPAEHGFHMPAEWVPHRRCWMAWPCREELWGDRLDAAHAAYADVARAVAAFEPVTMICRPADVTEASLACGPGIEVMSVDIDDSWVRDTGPTFLVDQIGGLAGVDWRFNGWGGRYWPFDNEDALAGVLIGRVQAHRFEAPFVLEGGAIHVDGEGTVLATEACLLNANRNPSMSREAIEQGLRDYLGVRQVIWLAGGLEDDETDGHVDNVACFVRPGVVLAMVAEDPGDGNHAVLNENLERLRAAKDAADRPLEIITVPQPPRRMDAGKRLPLSYVNLYIANGGVVMPAFGAAEDQRAYRVVRDAFPGRLVHQVPADDIVIGGGGIHCITQQQPSVEHHTDDIR